MLNAQNLAKGRLNGIIKSENHLGWKRKTFKIESNHEHNVTEVLKDNKLKLRMLYKDLYFNDKQQHKNR